MNLRVVDLVCCALPVQVALEMIFFEASDPGIFTKEKCLQRAWFCVAQKCVIFYWMISGSFIKGKSGLLDTFELQLRGMMPIKTCH